MNPFGFCSATYQSAIPNADAQLAMNIYPEFIESGAGKSPVGLIVRPGLRTFASLAGESACMGMLEVNGRGFVAGNNLWEVFASGPPVNRGALVAPTHPITMCANQANQILINSAGRLWVFKTDDNIITPVTMSQFRGPVSWIGFNNAAFIAQIAGTNFFQVSSLLDGTTWDIGADIYQVEAFPENIVSMCVAFGEVWVQGNKTSVAFQDTGELTNTYQPANGARMEQGSGAQYSAVKMDNTAFWIGSSEYGDGMAWRANGYTPQRVSTHAVEFAWRQYSTIADAIGFAIQFSGHSWWVLYFPTAKKTWIYDAATQAWHEQGYWDTPNGQFIAHRMRCHMLLNGKHLVGDWKTGTVYEMTADVYSDFGNPLRWIRRAPYIKSQSMYAFMPEGIEFEMSSGSGPMPPLLDGSGNPRDPEIILRWSDDSGHNWSNEHALKIGQAGQYAKRVVYRRMGKFLGRKGRVIEASGSDAVPYRFVDAYV